MKSKAAIAIILLFFQLQAKAQSLNCEFGFMGVAILTTTSKLNVDLSLGSHTQAAFQGAPAKEIPNLIFTANPPLIYFFQLDEGFDSNNITITVSSQKNTAGAFLAVVENPQTPQFKKMNGTCSIK